MMLRSFPLHHLPFISIIIFVVEKQKQNQAQDSFQLSKLHAPWAVIGQ